MSNNDYEWVRYETENGKRRWRRERKGASLSFSEFFCGMSVLAALLVKGVYFAGALLVAYIVLYFLFRQIYIYSSKSGFIIFLLKLLTLAAVIGAFKYI